MEENKKQFNWKTFIIVLMLTSDSHAESCTAVEAILNDNGFNAKNLQDIAEQEESERNIVTISILALYLTNETGTDSPMSFITADSQTVKKTIWIRQP